MDTKHFGMAVLAVLVALLIFGFVEYILGVSA